MKSLPIRLVVLLGVVSIVGITAVQLYWVRRAFDNEERQLDRTLYIGLKNVAARLAAYRGAALPPGQSPVNQRASNYYVVNVNDVIDANLLEFYLRQEFERLNLRLDYEYGIYDCGTDRMVYGDYVSAGGPGKPAARPTTHLPKYSRYTYYFGLHLPQRAPYLVSRLNGWMLTSGLLLLVVVFFGYALFVILRQKRLADVQRDFINAMSHEFRTPITTIGLSAQELLAPDAAAQPQRLRSYASIIQAENHRLSQQVDKVLQMARSERRGFRLQPEAVALPALLAQVVRQFDVAGKHAGGQVELQVAPAARAARVWADPLHLTNVLFNLLDNAVKYAGSAAPRVRVALDADGPRLRLRVADQGLGIAPAYQKRVFDKFFRVPAAGAALPTPPGFGLGLYYVRNVVAAHGWRLTLTSQAGQGSTFTLTLPPAARVPAAAPVASAAASAPAASATASAAHAA